MVPCVMSTALPKNRAYSGEKILCAIDFNDMNRRRLKVEKSFRERHEPCIVIKTGGGENVLGKKRDVRKERENL